jgi:hypothetical protein
LSTAAGDDETHEEASSPTHEDVLAAERAASIADITDGQSFTEVKAMILRAGRDCKQF